MYNRYIRNDNGAYERIPEEPAPRPGGSSSGGPPPGGPSSREASPGGPPPGGASPGGPPPGGQTSGGPGGPRPGGRPGRAQDGLTGILQHLLDQFRLDHVDTGDLLLLALLFFLFRENADEELLVALGLLLIL